MRGDHSRVLRFLHGAAALKREDLWCGEPVYIPSVRQQFSLLPQLPFIGADYGPGGWLLVGANPSSTEGRDPDKTEAAFAGRDAENIRLFNTFKESGCIADFEALNRFKQQDMQGWRMDWCIAGTLDRLGCDLDDVVVGNVVPFSTKDAPKRGSVVWRNAVALYFGQLMEVLKPAGVLWLGKAAFDRSFPFLTRRPEQESVVSRQRNLTMEARFAELDLLTGRQR